MTLPAPSYDSTAFQSTTSFAPGERFVLWSFRRWVAGLCDNDGGHWSLVWNDFAKRFGEDRGRHALSEFAGMMNALVAHARRPITYHQPCCPCLSLDEARFIALVAACQNRRLDLAQILADWFVEAEALGGLLDAANGLATTMAHHALTLPDPVGKPAAAHWPAPAAGEGVTLH